MKTTSLFAVAVMVSCSVGGARLLASGQPACGNVVAKGESPNSQKPKPQPQPPPKPKPAPKPASVLG